MKNKKKKVKEKDENVIEETVDTQENEEELAPNRFDEFVDGVIEKKDSVKPKGKKTIVLALVSIILFALTFALQSIYTNYLAPVGENEIVNWMFVTGSKNADVANAETYNQASKDNRIRKPIFDRYVHTVYNIDSSKDERVLSVITEYAPVKITLNDQEIYNNGYGKKKIVGNSVINEEADKYSWQSPIAFCNWVTTDPLIHPEEQDEDEDWITLNTESIKSKNSFNSGEFASYHVYPYYPDTMSYQKDYIKYKDESGKINTFEAYLKDLKTAHTMPIIIAEFGVSTSRGKAHESLMGWNQGEMEESKAGEAIVEMFKSIYAQKYAGGIVFSWQDEWFKRTWNNEDFDNSERRPFWANYQTCEQFFGLLAFDPGEEKSVCTVDGDTSEWSEKDIVSSGKNATLSMKSDEGYVYFMVDTKNDFDFNKDEILIPIDTVANQGNTKMNSTKTSFSEAADFLIQIKGKKNSRILCDAYYDVFNYFYGYQGRNFAQNDEYAKKNTGIFNKMNMCTGFKITIPSTKQKVPFAYYETGLLHYGNADPKSKNYDSLSDFCEKDGKIEIRIPWQLLNFTDPSKGEIMSDFYERQSIVGKTFNGFTVGVGIGETKINMDGKYTYTYWKDNPTYHERLKKSYYILKKELPNIGG